MPLDDTQCADMELLLQADLDGELDAADSAAVIRHRERCARCSALYDNLQRLRKELREDLSYHKACDDLRARLQQQLAARSTSTVTPIVAQPIAKTRRAQWLYFGAGAALAAAVAFVVVSTGEPPLADSIATEHIRSLQAEHLLDVVSTDQHTVKPWFNGKLDFVPPVRDFVAEGFPLAGGRLDYLGGRTVAALVYHRAKHPINVFVWPAAAHERETAIPECLVRFGYNLCRWSAQAMNFWAVSDVNAGELRQFVDLWQKAE